MDNDFFNKSVSKKNSFLAKKIVNYNNLSFFVRIIKHLQFVWNIVLLAEVIYFKLISRLTKCHDGSDICKDGAKKSTCSCRQFVVLCTFLKYRPIFKMWKRNVSTFSLICFNEIFLRILFHITSKNPSVYLQDVLSSIILKNSMEKIVREWKFITNW